MRILMFGWEFPPYMSGGLGTACYEMTNALARKGTKIKFIQPQLKGIGEVPLTGGMTLASASGLNLAEKRYYEKIYNSVHGLWRENLSVVSVDSTLIPYVRPETYDEYIKTLNLTTFANQSAEGAEYEKHFISNLRGGYGPGLMDEVHRYSQAAGAIALDSDFDVIHCHDWMTYPAGVVAKALTGKPLVIHVHSLEYDRSGSNFNPELYQIEKTGLDAADRVVAVSYYTKNLVMQYYGIPEEKIDVVHNAVTKYEGYKKYNIPELVRPEKRVLFLGRLTFQKGPEYFVEAAHMVSEKIPNVRFIMAGTGDMMNNLVRRVGQKRMGHCFHFTGFMNRTEVEHMYALSDLYVMPSVSEPFGITPLEAMASDVPVLISRQSGVAEILRNALVVDFWDTREMANKICAVLSYPALAAELVKNCREDLKNIKWENAAEQLNRIYASVM